MRTESRFTSFSLGFTENPEEIAFEMTVKQLGAEWGEVIGIEIIDTLRTKGLAFVMVAESIQRID